MTEIIMYCTRFCPYCVRAESLLQNKGMQIEKIRVDRDREMAKIMVEKSGGLTSVPQIFINQVHVGGFDELVALDREGKLDPMLNID